MSGLEHIDPVCGMKVDANSAERSVGHQDQSYYFCGPGCRQKFEADPARYLQPRRADAPAGSPENQAGEYTCPMHPEVRQTGAGTCPKCGMGLEAVAVPASRVQYVCPMHPEIVRSVPGSCPICGMALELREISAVEEENPELHDMTRRFWVSLGLTLPVLVAGMSEYLPGDPLHRLAPASFWTWFELVLATPVVLWRGWPLFRAGLAVRREPQFEYVHVDRTRRSGRLFLQRGGHLVAGPLPCSVS